MLCETTVSRSEKNEVFGNAKEIASGKKYLMMVLE
jgi:hypothetical protein